MEAVIGNQTIKQVRSFRYLGSLMSENRKCDAEKRSRIAKLGWTDDRDIDKYEFEQRDTTESLKRLHTVRYDLWL